jgi:hypothetical protein
MRKTNPSLLRSRKSDPLDTASAKDTASPPPAIQSSVGMPQSPMENLLNVMQHVVTIIEQALNNHRRNWNKLVFLGERHASALSCVKMLRCYQAAGGAALHYLNDDLEDLLRVPDLAEKMRNSLQGETKLTVALHFLQGLESGLRLD